MNPAQERCFFGSCGGDDAEMGTMRQNGLSRRWWRKTRTIQNTLNSLDYGEPSACSAVLSTYSTIRKGVNLKNGVRGTHRNFHNSGMAPAQVSRNEAARFSQGFPVIDTLVAALDRPEIAFVTQNAWTNTAIKTKLNIIFIEFSTRKNCALQYLLIDSVQ